MYLNQLNLRQFRNYQILELSFDHHVNVFLGENAQGKTNVLEAIYVLSLAKSHRTTKDRELIRWDEEFARVQGTFTRNTGRLSLDLIFSSKGKQAKVNGLEQRKLSDYIGLVNVVMFAPEDLNLVKGNPQVRRKFLDMEIGQMNRVYLHQLGLYQQVLKQRNHLLKNLQSNKNFSSMLDILTEQLIDLAAEITIRRFEFIKRLKQWANGIHYEISKGKEQLEVRYLPSIDVSEEANLSKMIDEFNQVFRKERQREIGRGVTLFGPHRDDLCFFVNGQNVQTYGSQGQQRTTALAVKLAEIELIYSEIGEYPILLLDDVLSELDDHRKSHLLKSIQGKVQTFITTTNIEGIDHDTLKQAAIYHVTNGTIHTK